MWHTVTVDQRPSKFLSRSRRATAAEGSVTNADQAAGSIDPKGPGAIGTARSLARKLRSAARALTSSGSGSPEQSLVGSVILPSVEGRVTTFLAAAKVPPFAGVSVQLLALGIGPFHPSESKSGFTQMAAFLAVQTACQRIVEASSRARGDPGEEISVELRCAFYDPCCSSMHSECCKLLRIVTEKENKKGAYKVLSGSPRRRSLLIVYAPHCPWPLLHNLFAVNWPPVRSSTSPLDALQHLYVVGNDPLDVPLVRNTLKLCVFHPEFPSLLTIHRLESLHGRKRDRRGNVDAEAEEDGHWNQSVEGLGCGVSRVDLHQAFCGTACYQLRTDLTDNDLLARLSHVASRAPAVVKKCVELR